MLCLRIALILGLVGVVGCGTTGSTPVAPREARFVVNAPSGTEFQVNEFLATNGPPHTYGGVPRTFTAPYTFIFLNAGKPPETVPNAPIDPAVSGTFQGVDASANVQIDLFVARSSNPVESLVASGSILAGSTAETIVSTPEPTPMPDPPTATEFRVEVFDNEDPTYFNELFNALLGDQRGSLATCGDSRICNSPTTFYFEDPQGFFSVVIQKLVNDNRSLRFEVYINNVLYGANVAHGTDKVFIHVNL